MCTCRWTLAPAAPRGGGEYGCGFGGHVCNLGFRAALQLKGTAEGKPWHQGYGARILTCQVCFALLLHPWCPIWVAAPPATLLTLSLPPSPACLLALSWPGHTLAESRQGR